MWLLNVEIRNAIKLTIVASYRVYNFGIYWSRRVICSYLDDWSIQPKTFYKSVEFQNNGRMIITKLMTIIIKVQHILQTSKRTSRQLSVSQHESKFDSLIRMTDVILVATRLTVKLMTIQKKVNRFRRHLKVHLDNYPYRSDNQNTIRGKIFFEEHFRGCYFSCNENVAWKATICVVIVMFECSRLGKHL